MGGSKNVGITRRESLKALFVGGVIASGANCESRARPEKQKMKVFEFIGEKGRALSPGNPAISGGNPWLKWCDCEPTEGTFDWTRMDEAM